MTVCSPLTDSPKSLLYRAHRYRYHLPDVPNHPQTQRSFLKFWMGLNVNTFHFE